MTDDEYMAALEAIGVKACTHFFKVKGWAMPECVMCGARNWAHRANWGRQYA